eukprot:1303113-Prymnesium_polylepis.1
MTRAMQTIQPLARRVALPVTVDPEVIEVFGFFQKESGVLTPKCGPTRASVEERFPGYDASRVPRVAAPAGEREEESRRRAAQVAERLQSEAAQPGACGRVVVIVSREPPIESTQLTLARSPLLGLLPRCRGRRSKAYNRACCGRKAQTATSSAS